MLDATSGSIELHGTMTCEYAEALGHRTSGSDVATDLSRLLAADGVTGRLVLYDAATGMPRLIVSDVLRAAELVVSDRQVRRWRPARSG